MTINSTWSTASFRKALKESERALKRAEAQLRREAWAVGQTGLFPAYEPPTPQLRKLEDLTPGELDSIPWGTERPDCLDNDQTTEFLTAALRKIPAPIGAAAKGEE